MTSPEPHSDSHADKRSPPGLLGTFRNILQTCLAIIHTRLELITTEIEEEIQRAATILLWVLIALFFASLTVLMLTVTLLIVFWDDHRVLASSLITASFFVIAVVMALLARGSLKARDGFLSASVEALKRDREALQRKL